jgi:hypothetical protein
LKNITYGKLREGYEVVVESALAGPDEDQSNQ